MTKPRTVERVPLDQLALMEKDTAGPQRLRRSNPPSAMLVAPGPFTADDIAALMRDLPGLVDQQEDPAKFAEQLNSAIWLAIAYGNEFDHRLSPSANVQYLETLKGLAEALLQHMGLPVSSFEPSAIQSADWLKHLLRGIQGSTVLPQYLARPLVAGVDFKQIQKQAPVDMDHRAKLYGKVASVNQDEQREMQEATATALLRAAPLVISLIATAAQAAAVPYQSRKGKRGARPDKFRHILFRELATVHKAMFKGGLRIKINRDRSDIGPSVIWLQRVLRLATERTTDWDAKVHSRLEALSQQKLQTLGSYLEDAVKEIRRNSVNFVGVRRPNSSA